MYAAIVFLPIIGSAIAGLFGRIIGARAIELVTTGAAVRLRRAVAACAFNDVALQGHNYIIPILPWIHSGDFRGRLDGPGRQPDGGDAGGGDRRLLARAPLFHRLHGRGSDSRPRFFSYLSLFTFAMLMLVTANNFLQLFFGWEGVGLASYLLIGFWYTQPAANAAAIKAFIVNRVGDFGFALGIFGVCAIFSTLDFDAVFAAAPAMVGQDLPSSPAITSTS